MRRTVVGQEREKEREKDLRQDGKLRSDRRYARCRKSETKARRTGCQDACTRDKVSRVIDLFFFSPIFLSLVLKKNFAHVRVHEMTHFLYFDFRKLRDNGAHAFLFKPGRTSLMSGTIGVVAVRNRGATPLRRRQRVDAHRDMTVDS